MRLLHLLLTVALLTLSSVAGAARLAPPQAAPQMVGLNTPAGVALRGGPTIATPGEQFVPAGACPYLCGNRADALVTCVTTAAPTVACADGLKLTYRSTNGQLTGTTLGATSDSWAYDTFGAPSTYAATTGVTTRFQEEVSPAASPRDALGRITRRVDTPASGTVRSWDYRYDRLGRLSEAWRDGALYERYSYDSNGNRVSLKTADGVVDATYDAQDRLVTYGDWAYTFGANGDLQQKRNTATGERWQYHYDALGRLLSVQVPDGRLIEYRHDPLGRRVAKLIDGTVVRQWLYRDGLKPAAELDGNGLLLARFAYGSKPTVPDFIIRGGETYRILSDHLGSPVLAVNVNDPSDRPFQASYSPFGEAEGTNLDWLPFGFAGGHYDTDTGLVRFGARDYEPMTGRWTAKDPIRWEGGQANLYLYVDGDPVNRVDPDGTFAFLAIPVLLGGGGASSAALWTAAVGGAVLLGLAIDDLIHNWDRVYNRDERKALKHLADKLGRSYRDLSDELHRLKDAAGLKGRPTDVSPDGSVVDPRSGDPIGNVCDD